MAASVERNCYKSLESNALLQTKGDSFMKMALSILAFAISSQALASNYPANYCHQVVRALHDGPALFANVSSGCGSQQVIGYEANGVLAADNPDFVDAVVVAKCGPDIRTSVVRLGREWHGKGYMSAGHSFYSYLPQGCYPFREDRIYVSFSANGRWDSRYGQNYSFSGQDFYERNDVRVFETHEQGTEYVGLRAWDFIVSEMDK